jgi:hypothetical protein
MWAARLECHDAPAVRNILRRPRRGHRMSALVAAS